MEKEALMTPQELTAWRLSMALSVKEAALALDLSPSTFQRYEAGSMTSPLAISYATKYLVIARIVTPLT